MSTSFLGGVIFVVVFAGIILVHELGHFIIARLMKIDVEEFAIGFPPRLARLWRTKGSLVIGEQRLGIPLNFDLPFDPKASLHRQVNAVAVSARGATVLRSIEIAAEDGAVATPAAPLKTGETRISGKLNEAHPGTEIVLNWIPLGGYNKIKGEDDPGAPGGMAGANPLKRIAVLLGGASMNLLTGVLVYSFFFAQIGVPDTHTAVITSVNDTSPAQTAGLQAGDIVVAAGGQHVTSYNLLIEITQTYLGKPLALVILRGGQVEQITVTPRSIYPPDQGPMGVSVGQPLVPARSWFDTIPAAFTATGQDINSLLSLPGRIIAGTISPEAAQIGGPRSVWNLFQQAVSRDVTSRQTSSTSTTTATRPTNYTLLTIISLTITVAVANLLPIPALDGGRIFMTLIEIVIRRPISAKYQAAINGIGFIVLLSLLGFFYIKDMISPVNFTLP
jgi:regulator of sigma E protease